MAGEVAQVCLGDVEAAGSGRGGRRPAQHAHRAGVVPARAIDELPGDRVGRTAGHHQRGAAHLRLAVARVDPYGVQLEQLTAEVLVRRLLGRHVVIEVVQHRRVQAAGNQQVGEAAQCVRPDHVGVEAVTAVPDVAGRAGDVEVVRPELDHHLLQLAPAPGRPQQRRLAKVLHHVPGAHRELAAHQGDGVGQPGIADEIAVAGRVVDGGRLQLPGQPTVRTQLPRLGHQRRSQPVRRPAQQVQQRVGRRRGRRVGRRSIEYGCGGGDCDTGRGQAEEAAPAEPGVVTFGPSAARPVT